MGEEIGIVDTDVSLLVNLNRQILHTEADLSAPKVGIRGGKAAKAEEASIRFHPMQVYLDENNAQEILTGYDLVVDCVDNGDTHYLINLLGPYAWAFHWWGASGD